MTNKLMSTVLIERVREVARGDGTVDVAEVERVIRNYLDAVMDLPKPPGALGFDRGRGARRP